MPGITSTALPSFSHDQHHKTDAAKWKGTEFKEKFRLDAWKRENHHRFPYRSAGFLYPFVAVHPPPHTAVVGIAGELGVEEQRYLCTNRHC